MKYLLYPLAFLAIMACSNEKQIVSDKVELAPTQENVIVLTDVQLDAFERTQIKIEQENLDRTLKVNGLIDVSPQNLRSVSSPVGGYVKAINFLPGMPFKKGQIIASLKDNQIIQLQQDYLEAKALLQNAEAEFQRQDALNQSKASSDKVYLQAKTDYETLKIQVHALDQKLRLIQMDPREVQADQISDSAPIYAPFDGFISQIFINIGKYVSPSDVLFELINPLDLQLKLQLFEKDWDQVQIGQTLTAFTNSLPNEQYPGKITLVSKNIREDRALDVFAKLDKSSGNLIPGMYMNAEIRIPESSAWTLPEESVLSFEGKQFVFVQVKPNEFEMIEVQTAKSSGDRIEILNAQNLFDKVIIHKGAYTLLMALKNKSED